MPAAALLSPRSASRGPPGPPKNGQGGPKIAHDGPRKWRPSTGKSCKICSGALLGPSWGQLGPLRAQLGPSVPILKRVCLPICFFQAATTTTKRPNNHFVSFLKILLPEKSAKIQVNQDTKEPKNQCTSARGRSGGMRGAIESAAPEGEQGVLN